MAQIGRAGVMITTLSPAARAFDAVAPDFDARFRPWLSVAAQRRAVRTVLLREFAQGAKIIEVGGGTGEDAAFLAERGYQVLLTDSSPAMVSIARRKLLSFKSRAEVAAAEEYYVDYEFEEKIAKEKLCAVELRCRSCAGCSRPSPHPQTRGAGNTRSVWHDLSRRDVD